MKMEFQKEKIGKKIKYNDIIQHNKNFKVFFNTFYCFFKNKY